MSPRRSPVQAVSVCSSPRADGRVSFSRPADRLYRLPLPPGFRLSRRVAWWGSEFPDGLFGRLSVRSLSAPRTGFIHLACEYTLLYSLSKVKRGEKKTGQNGLRCSTRSNRNNRTVRHPAQSDYWPIWTIICGYIGWNRGLLHSTSRPNARGYRRAERRADGGGTARTRGSLSGRPQCGRAEYST